MDEVIHLPPHLRMRLCHALDAGLLTVPYSVSGLQSVLGIREGAEEVVSELGRLETSGVSGKGVAELIRAVERATNRMPKPDVVWSGPEVKGLHARDTRRVYEQLLGSAKRSVWVSSYAFFDGPRAFDVLARRMDDTPGLSVMLLLNIQRKRGDITKSAALVRKFADRFWATDWPGSSRPTVFYDPRALDEDGPGGVLHAKADPLIARPRDPLIVSSQHRMDGCRKRESSLHPALLIAKEGVAGSNPVFRSICFFSRRTAVS